MSHPASRVRENVAKAYSPARRWRT